MRGRIYIEQQGQGMSIRFVVVENKILDITFSVISKNYLSKILWAEEMWKCRNEESSHIIHTYIIESIIK